MINAADISPEVLIFPEMSYKWFAVGTTIINE